MNNVNKKKGNKTKHSSKQKTKILQPIKTVKSKVSKEENKQANKSGTSKANDEICTTESNSIKKRYTYNNTSEKDEEKPKGNIPPLSFKRKRPKDDTRTKSDDFKRKAFNEEIDKSVETSSEEIK